MKLTYDIIKENLRVFEEAKIKFPIIQKYINGDVTYRALQSVGLYPFAQFYDYIKLIGKNPIIDNVTWRKLKPLLIDKTDLPRFKTYLRNRTQTQFNGILKDIDVYDRLVNGRWLTKPNKRSSGRRSDEKISSFTNCSIEIINYIIQNDIDVCDGITGTQWFISNKLSLDECLVREMQVTEDMLKSIADVISDSKVDFKKLNLDYITNFIGEKLHRLITIEKGKSVKCIKNLTETNITGNPVSILTEGKSYTVEASCIRSGYLSLWITDDRGRGNYYPFSNFEDIAFQRNSILDSLLG